MNKKIKYNPFKTDIRNKYLKHGAYHWVWYKRKLSYREGVDYLKEWIKEKNVLDVGAGDGLIPHILNIRGVDIDRDGIAAAKSKGVIVDYGDAANLPYKDEEFDAVLMYDTLEHLEHPIESLKEARRVSKFCLYIVVPSTEGAFRTNEKKLTDTVVSVGFKLENEIYSRKVRGIEQYFAKFIKI